MKPVAVLLAGGQGRRMGGLDKPLLELAGRPLLDHAIARIRPQVAAMVLSANGDVSRFSRFGLAVIADTVPGFAGPLAGVLAGMRWATARGAARLLSVPGDTPFLPDDLVARLAAPDAPIAFAQTAGRPHPAVALWSVALADALEAALRAGQRRVSDFAAAHGAVAVPFPRDGSFFNINRPEDLELAERMSIADRRTARLLLRPPAAADLDFTASLFARPELVAHRPDPRPDPSEASAARLKKDMAHWTAHGFGRWAAEHDGRLIGFGGVTHRDGHADLNLSYHLHPDAWGQGFASELVAEALAVAFGPLAAPRVVGLVRPANPASRRVLERAGFAAEAEIDLHGAPTILLARYPGPR